MNSSTKKLKILHVHDVAFVASTLVSGLQEIGVDAELYEFLNFKKLHLPRILGLLVTLFLRFYEIFRLNRYLRKEKFDIVHVHYGSFAYLAFINRVPYFLHIHGTDVRTYIHWPILGNIIRHGINKARVVFYTTPDLKALVNPFRQDATFFPNSINTEIFKPIVGKNLTCDLTIFNINKLDRFKGVDQVLRGIELLWEQAPHVRVIMFEFGNATEEAREFLEKYRDNSRLSLISRVSHEKMVSLINETSLILGSMGTGILTCSELEAMACAKPVICKFKYSDMYPTPPPIYNAESPEEIRDHILHILNNPEQARQIGIEARQWIMKYYDNRIIAQKLLEIYRDYCD